MGRYDDISDAKLRYEIQRFARILQRMEEEDEVLDRTADILTLLGELRRMVFAWEVRSTFRGEEGGGDTTGSEPAPDSRPRREARPQPGAGSDGSLTSDSERIVREAEEQQSDFLGGLTPPSREEDEDDPEPSSSDGDDTIP